MINGRQVYDRVTLLLETSYVEEDGQTCFDEDHFRAGLLKIRDEIEAPPVTPKKHASLGDYQMPFGKHKGERLDDVPANYLEWLADQDWLSKWPKVQEYIEKESLAIKQEAAPVQRELPSVYNNVSFDDDDMPF